jgi:hypothetical protein
VERARAFGKRLKAGLAIIDKRREGPNVAKVMNIIGEVKGLQAIILDDMVDTGGTLVEAAAPWPPKAPPGWWPCCTHPVLSGPAIERLEREIRRRIERKNLRTRPVTLYELIRSCAPPSARRSGAGEPGQSILNPSWKPPMWSRSPTTRGTR